VAKLSYQDLVAALMQHPNYSKWELEVPADQALYVAVTNPALEALDTDSKPIRTEVFEMANGLELVLDLNAHGKVLGFEIV
jgi:uncharacterized protein YuzE